MSNIVCHIHVSLKAKQITHAFYLRAPGPGFTIEVSPEEMDLYDRPDDRKHGARF